MIRSARAMWAATGMLFGLTVVGCAAKVGADDPADKFREAIPQSQDVTMGVPGSSGAAPAQAEAPFAEPSSALKPQATASAPSYATYYAFTRNFTDGVDAVTALVLGSVWLIVHTPPSTVSDHQAVWGPGQGDALSPVVWRLTVTETAPAEFDYELDGRPKTSSSDGDYVAVLSGHGYGKDHPMHRNGTFVIDNDAAHALDPLRNQDTGKVTVDYRLREWPATIAVQLRPSDKPDWLDVTVTHQQDHSGAVDLSGLADIDTVKDGNLEDIVIHSRWNPTGAGRADVTLSGGSLGASTVVEASECWSSSFARTYYTDSANYQPTEGDPATCAFPATP